MLKKHVQNIQSQFDQKEIENAVNNQKLKID